MSYTPGPWHVEITDKFEITMVFPERYRPNDPNDDYFHICDDVTKFEDAQLIAAAPELLEACELALEQCPFPVGATKAKAALQNAINKAKGKESN